MQTAAYIHTKSDSTRRDCGSVQRSKSLLHKSKAYLRDSDGRNLDQAILASGNKTFASDASYFLRTLSDDQVREIDPASDLYPFMIAASGETSDLSAVYVLLRRNPSLVRGGNIS